MPPRETKGALATTCVLPCKSLQKPHTTPPTKHNGACGNVDQAKGGHQAQFEKQSNCACGNEKFNHA
ncbi:MAG: hypothetical protein IJD18_04855, partial [Clostridia bacterium]|nr:hypothetical protein [Clostridia bacterium]